MKWMAILLIVLGQGLHAKLEEKKPEKIKSTSYKIEKGILKEECLQTDTWTNGKVLTRTVPMESCLKSEKKAPELLNPSIDDAERSHKPRIDPVIKTGIGGAASAEEK